jgi:competence protein ComEA
MLDSLSTPITDSATLYSGKFERQNIDYERIDYSVAEQKLHPFKFNPNHLPVGDWKKLGLTDKQIRTIKNYESAGGKFRIKEDFKKIYGITESEYEILAPFITIPQISLENHSPLQQYNRYEATPINRPNVKRLMVNLNSADSAELVEIRGIGPIFARRIIKYRNLLGGFYNKTQLLEVYGLDERKYEEVAGYCTADETQVHKINVNTASINELKKHPYLDYYSAKAIVDRRVSRGNYVSVEQVREIPAIDSNLYRRIRSYLTIE